MRRPLFLPTAFTNFKEAINDPEGSYRDYNRALQYRLLDIKDFKLFERQVVAELSELNINGWSYVRLDIPLQLSMTQCIGTIPLDYYETYNAEGFHRSDFILQHLGQSMTPIFKSDVDQFVQNSPLVTPEINHYKELSALNNRFGCKESYYIPLISPKGGGRAAFALHSSGVCSRAFKENVENNKERLRVIGRVIHHVGPINFPDRFTDEKRTFQKLVKSQPFNLLVTMVKFDLTLNQAAERLGISVNTAQKHISNIRRALGAKTNYGAYETALQQGLIYPS